MNKKWSLIIIIFGFVLVIVGCFIYFNSNEATSNSSNNETNDTDTIDSDDIVVEGYETNEEALGHLNDVYPLDEGEYTYVESTSEYYTYEIENSDGSVCTYTVYIDNGTIEESCLIVDSSNEDVMTPE